MRAHSVDSGDDQGEASRLQLASARESALNGDLLIPRLPVGMMLTSIVCWHPVCFRRIANLVWQLWPMRWQLM